MDLNIANDKIKALILSFAFLIICLSYILTINSEKDFYQSAYLFIAPFLVEIMDCFYLKEKIDELEKILNLILMIYTGLILLLFSINIFFIDFLPIKQQYCYIMIAIYPIKLFGNLMFLLIKILFEE